MNLAISEKDKKLLSLLISLLLIAVFIFLVFRPFVLENQRLEEEAVKIRQEATDLDAKSMLTQEMLAQEKTMSEEMELILARYYPLMQSQQVESMATTLMLNHSLDIQSLAIIMPEKESTLKWYQYSTGAVTAQAETEQKEQEAEEVLALYVAKATCVADGSSENIWALIDDISANYPAISIANTEWSTVEQTVAPTTGEQNPETEEAYVAPNTITTNRVTLTLEIYMSNR